MNNIWNIESSLFVRKVSEYFQFSERDTSFKQEFIAGTSSFLAISYVLIVNPYLLSFVGIPSEIGVISTGISAGIGCIISGIFSNLPFVVAPGMGFSAYITCGLVFGVGFTRAQTFTSSFLAGLLVGICSLTGLSSYIVRIVPRSVQIGNAVGIGLLISLIGLSSINLVDSNENTIVGIGSVWNTQLWFSMCGVVLVGTLMHHNIPGAILIGITTLTSISWLIKRNYEIPTVFHVPNIGTIYEFIDFASLDTSCIPPILAILLAQLFDINGVIAGMASLANLTENGVNIPGSTFTYVGASMGSMIAASMGCSSLTVHLESAAGIVCGGVTGFTAVVTGIYFLISIFFAPLLGFAPAVATAPVLVIIGTMLMAQAKLLDWNVMNDAIPAFLTLVVTPFTFSIANGLLFGLFTSFCFSITTGKKSIDMLHYLLFHVLWVNNHDHENSNNREMYQSRLRYQTSENTINYYKDATIDSRMNYLRDNINDGGNSDVVSLNVRTPSLLVSKVSADAVERARGKNVSESIRGRGYIEVLPSMSSRPIYE
jgi:AGZA family xanthine/uracil permease-like MFS transporter